MLWRSRFANSTSPPQLSRQLPLYMHSSPRLSSFIFPSSRRSSRFRGSSCGPLPSKTVDFKAQIITLCDTQPLSALPAPFGLSLLLTWLLTRPTFCGKRAKTRSAQKAFRAAPAGRKTITRCGVDGGIHEKEIYGTSVRSGSPACCFASGASQHFIDQRRRDGCVRRGGGQRQSGGKERGHWGGV